MQYAINKKLLLLLSSLTGYVQTAYPVQLEYQQCLSCTFTKEDSEYIHNSFEQICMFMDCTRYWVLVDYYHGALACNATVYNTCEEIRNRYSKLPAYCYAKVLDAANTLSEDNLQRIQMCNRPCSISLRKLLVWLEVQLFTFNQPDEWEGMLDGLCSIFVYTSLAKQRARQMFLEEVKQHKLHESTIANDLVTRLLENILNHYRGGNASLGEIQEILHLLLNYVDSEDDSVAEYELGPTEPLSISAERPKVPACCGCGSRWDPASRSAPPGLPAGVSRRSL